MIGIWRGLPAAAQDSLLMLVLLLPGLVLAAVVLRGFVPGPLVRALLWRFRWANLVFVGLIAVSVGMGIGLIAQERGLRQGTARAADKFDMVISAPGSELTMMLAAVFLQASDVPLLDGETYAEVSGHERVEIAAPLAFGDSWEGAPVVGTIADFVTYLSDGQIEGRLWGETFEAVAGAAVPLAIGDTFTPSHGIGEGADDQAHGDSFTITGRLPRTGSPWDRAIMVPVEAVWSVHGLADGHAPEAVDRLGPPFDPAYFPGTPAIVVRAESLPAIYALRSQFTRDAETMAFFPGTVLTDLYRVMGDVRQAMSALTLVTQVLVAASVLLGLFILSRLFRRQLALLRALGAPPRFVVAVVWSYAAALLVTGCALGLALGYGTAAVLSRVVTARTDILVEARPGWTELHLSAGFLSAMLLLSLVPAWSVLRARVMDGIRG